jgi:hypothetical protein
MESFDILNTYEKILSAHKAGGRGLIKFEPSLRQTLVSELKNLDPKNPDQKLYAMFCILSHTTNPIFEAHDWLLACLQHYPAYNVEMIVACLSASLKNHVEGSQVQGIKIKKEILDAYRPLLYHPSPLVIEWTLRVIESCGAQGLIFARELDQIKPPLWKLIFLTHRNIRELIALLERRWKSYGKR